MDAPCHNEATEGINMSIKEGSKIALPLLIVVVMITVAFGAVVQVSTPVAAAPDPLDPTTIPKWENQLTGPPPVYVSDSNNAYTVSMKQFGQQILPPSLNLTTTTWGYEGHAKDAVTGADLGVIANSPGPTFETEKGTPITVKWVNTITSSSLFAVDPTIHWANPNNMATPTSPFLAFPPGYAQAQSPVPLVNHVHGLEVQSSSDGGPDQWFTSTGVQGPGYRSLTPTDPNAAIFYYPNSQPPTTLFYHDHALGMTRLNLASGLAGFYLVRGENDSLEDSLPSGKYEVPLAIQDRSFNTDGSYAFPNVGVNPDDHPYWMPEFFGNTIMVNGQIWPNMNVDQGQYRFRIVDGSNARFYTLRFSNGMSFTQIGAEGGYLRAPVSLTSLTIAPGERADILVDFSNVTAGTKIIMENSANAPFPDGDPVDLNTTGQIMQFNVTSQPGHTASQLPSILNPQLNNFPSLGTPTTTRIKTLYEVTNTTSDTPMMVTLDGQMWDNPISEQPNLGATEEWKIPNLTGDTHPIHIHLTQWQVVSRQAFDVENYTADWEALNGGSPPYGPDHPTVPLDPANYLIGSPRGPDANEQGWKDTVRMNTGEVTVVKARFAPIDGSTDYPFNATVGPGYVWHCHIVDHEDNEMMRPYVVTESAPPAAPSKSVFVVGTDRALWWKSYNNETGSWSAWASLGGVVTASPAATTSSNGVIDVFVRGSDGALWQRTYSNGQWGSWTSLGGQLPQGSGPAATSFGYGDREVFVQGTDNALWMRNFDSQAQSWGNWTKLGGIVVASPGATTRGTDLIDVFVHGSDNALWWMEINRTQQAAPSWTSLGGQLPQGSGPAASSWGADRLDVFVQGTNNALWHRSMQGASWSAWESLGGVLTASPAAMSPATNVIDVFVRGSDGALWQREYSASWGSWSSLGGQIASGTGPAAS
jgi:FtsP/CotA-like multicopper oxidase with cupredoxin domain